MPEANESSGGLFVLLPLEVLHDPTISHAAKLTYARLGFFAGKNGRCNPSHETLAAEICLKPRQVRTVLAELKARGWLTWRRTRSSCWFTVSGPIPDRQKTATLDSDRQKTADLDRQKTATLEWQKTADKKMLSLKDVSLKGSLSEEWEIFKELYPSHRIDEDSARTEWNNRTDTDAIIKGVKLHLDCEEWGREMGRYIPKASKFIRDGLYRVNPHSAAEQKFSAFREQIQKRYGD